MKRTWVGAWLLIPLAGACARGVPVEEAVASISEEDYLRKISIIAHDSMMGRANPSPGLDMTARWIASEFRRYGLKPGGGGKSFLQTYTMREVQPDFEGSSLRVKDGPELVFGVDVNFMGIPATGSITGPAVLVAGNLMAEGVEFPHEELQGKHVLVITPPPAESPSGPMARRRTRVPPALVQAGPASIVVLDRSSDEEWDAAVNRTREQRQVRAPWASPSATTVLAVRENALSELLSPHGIRPAGLLAEAGEGMVVRELPWLEMTLQTAEKEVGSFDLPNVVGILEGRDPRLKQEYILFSAHMDHVGVGRPNAEGDSIRNGADDNASGTTAVVELAEAFAMLKERPARSLIFLAVSGEERGLWGSRFFAENPPVPLAQIVANLNADMISRNAPDSVVVIGKEHSDLGETLNRVNRARPELGLVAADDIWPEERFYFRSDHYNFARRGVPILFFFTGVHEDYHGVDDEVERIDVNKATRITKLLFHLGLELANAPARPQWNPDSYAQIVDMGGGPSR